MKRVHQDMLSEKPSSSMIDDRRKSHLRTIESEILALSHPPIRDHPNIIKILAWGFNSPIPGRRMGLPYLEVEKALGSLLDLLKTPTLYGEQAISFETRYQLSMDVLEGLRCVHNEGIVYGDVKPANTLVFRQQNPEAPFVAKIADFGMCVAVEEECSLSYGPYHGTPAWAAPELVKYREGCEEKTEDVMLSKCDVFSYGLLVLSVLYRSGKSPLDYDAYVQDSAIEAACHLLDDYKGSQLVDMGLKPTLKSFVHSTLRTNPFERSSLDRRLLAFDCRAFHTWSVLHLSNLLCFVVDLEQL